MGPSSETVHINRMSGDVSEGPLSIYCDPATGFGPRPQTFEPSVLLLIVGSCVTGPAPQTQPLTGFLGERNAVKLVGATPNGGTLAAGWKDGLQTSGRTVRVITFQFSLTWIGTTGWIWRMS
jgi:hypothetical protein